MITVNLEDHLYIDQLLFFCFRWLLISASYQKFSNHQRLSYYLENAYPIRAFLDNDHPFGQTISTFMILDTHTAIFKFFILFLKRYCSRCSALFSHEAVGETVSGFLRSFTGL